MNQFIQTLVEMFAILCILGATFSLGVVYGLADCPNIIEWIKRKLKLGKEAQEKQKK